MFVELILVQSPVFQEPKSEFRLPNTNPSKEVTT